MPKLLLFLSVLFFGQTALAATPSTDPAPISVAGFALVEAPARGQ